MTTETIKMLKKHKYHSNRTFLLLQQQCMKLGVSYYELRDAHRRHCRNFLKHFKK